jgi:hypothetical protein
MKTHRLRFPRNALICCCAYSAVLVACSSGKTSAPNPSHAAPPEVGVVQGLSRGLAPLPGLVRLDQENEPATVVEPVHSLPWTRLPDANVSQGHVARLAYTDTLRSR